MLPRRPDATEFTWRHGRLAAKAYRHLAGAAVDNCDSADQKHGTLTAIVHLSGRRRYVGRKRKRQISHFYFYRT